MFDAVELCEKKVEEFLKQNPKSKKGKSIEFPQVHLVVTGDGDMRKYYEEEWKKKNFNFFRLFTVYLPYSDYATLLGKPDLFRNIIASLLPTKISPTYELLILSTLI